MIDFLVSCLDLVFMWFSSESWLVILPFCVMVFSVCVIAGGSLYTLRA